MKTLFVFVGAGKDDGIMALGDSPENMRPMVTADPEMVDLYKGACRQITRATGKQIKLLKFENPTELETIG